MLKRIKSRLLHIANTRPAHREVFYKLKTELLDRYAESRGHVIQEITHKCWGRFDEFGDPTGCQGKECRRCGGSGVYTRFWVRLTQYQWGDYTFLVPIDKTFIEPDRVDIHGTVEHPQFGYQQTAECELWLFLLCLQFKTLHKVMRSGCFTRPRYPFLFVQTIYFRSRAGISRFLRSTLKRCDRCHKIKFNREHPWLCTKCVAENEDNYLDFEPPF